MYSYAWANAQDPIANGFILQSGSAVMTSDLSMGNASWYSVSAAVGCRGKEAGTATVACMRGKTMRELEEAGRSGPFMPRPDGKVVFNDYAARAKAGNFIKRPMFIGNNDNEGGFQRIFLQLFNISDPGGQRSKAVDILSAPMNTMMSCGAAQAAEARVAAGVPAWRYRYMAAYPNSQIVANASTVHGAEISLVFGTMTNTPTAARIPSTPEEEEEALSRAMRHAWAEFAKDPDKGLSKLGYPVYDSKKPTLVRIGNKNKGEIDLVQGDEYDASCPNPDAPPKGPLDFLSGLISFMNIPSWTSKPPLSRHRRAREIAENLLDY